MSQVEVMNSSGRKWLKLSNSEMLAHVRTFTFAHPNATEGDFEKSFKQYCGNVSEKNEDE
jgi:predicted extracellular nuclease